MRHVFRNSSRAICAGAAAILSLGANPASAECAGTGKIDECLVGAWKQTGGGAVEWMRRNMPGMTIPQAKQRGQVFVLNKDGRFWTAPMSSDMTIRMEDSRGAMLTKGIIKAQASGRWSAANGTFHLCTEKQKFEGQARIATPGGGQHTMPLSAPPSSGPVAFGYTCAGNRLETRKTIPGVADPMTTQYERTAAKGAAQ